MLTTTLTAIRVARPCASGYASLAKHLGKTEADDAPFPVCTILDSNNVADTCWTLSNVCGEPGWKILGLWAADCAEHVLPIFEKKMPGDSRPRDAIVAARAFIRGEISDAAWDAARDAAWAAARDVAWAAARAAARDAAWDAARDAAWAAARDVAWAAARAAARDAAGAAAGAAAWDAAWDAARDAEEKWQADRLRALLNGEAV